MCSYLHCSLAIAMQAVSETLHSYNYSYVAAWVALIVYSMLYDDYIIRLRMDNIARDIMDYTAATCNKLLYLETHSWYF